MGEGGKDCWIIRNILLIICFVLALASIPSWNHHLCHHRMMNSSHCDYRIWNYYHHPINYALLSKIQQLQHFPCLLPHFQQFSCHFAWPLTSNHKLTFFRPQATFKWCQGHNYSNQSVVKDFSLFPLHLSPNSSLPCLHTPIKQFLQSYQEQKWG